MSLKRRGGRVVGADSPEVERGRIVGEKVPRVLGEEM